MDIIDLNPTDENLMLSELAGLDVSGQEIFECVGVQEVEDTVELDEAAARQDLGNASVTVEAILPVSQTRKSIQEGHRNLERHIAISNMHQGPTIAPETVEERLERIGRELEELSSVNHESMAPTTVGELEKMQNLHLKLTHASKGRLEEIQKSFFPNEESVKDAFKVILPRVQFDSGDMQRLLELEKKISRLERIVGPVESLGKSVMTKLHELSSQIALLDGNSELLERFHERLRQVEEDYENSLLGRKSKKESALHQNTKASMVSYESRIDGLYRFNDTLQIYGPILPQLTEKVRQISAMDSKLSECARAAQLTDGCIADLQEQAATWKRANDSLEQKLAMQEAGLLRNREHFDQLLTSLESRLKPSKEV